MGDIVVEREIHGSGFRERERERERVCLGVGHLERSINKMRKIDGYGLRER